jgi:tRNA threonylcarbamoyladenosine biosynthesis protein TsaB
MRNLAIECSGSTPSLGVFENDFLIRKTQLASDLGSVRGLALAIQRLMAREHSALTPSRISPANCSENPQKTCEMLSVTVGPGSFTGLRVGLATAKMLAMAWEVPVSGVDTLHALAYQMAGLRMAEDGFLTSHARGEEYYVIPVMNAFRRQVFTALWRIDVQGTLVCICSSLVCDAAAWVSGPLKHLLARAAVEDEGLPAVVVGPGLEVYTPESDQRLSLARRESWSPSIEAVGKLGWQAYREGLSQDALTLLPNYVRASAAEEQARIKAGGQS